MKNYRLIIALTCCSLLPTHPASGVLYVAEDQQLTDPQTIETDVVNHGLITGTPEHKFEFGPSTLVKGDGVFENVVSWGIFAPGNSPGVVNGTNLTFAGTVQIELGGTIPGFGSGRHDQINDSGTLELSGGPVLEVLSFEEFVPQIGDEFEILTWTEGLVGDFGEVVIDPLFLASDISFEQVITNRNGRGSLTLVAVPEPSAFLFLAAAGAAAHSRTKRYRGTRRM